MPTGVVAQEAERLFSNLLHIECQPGAQWTLERCYEVAPLTYEINRLKAEKNAIILAHSYCRALLVPPSIPKSCTAWPTSRAIPTR